MGEIIVFICIGGFLVLAGIFMIATLSREEKSFIKKDKGDSPH